MTDIDFDELDRAINSVMKEPTRPTDTVSTAQTEDNVEDTSSDEAALKLDDNASQAEDVMPKQQNNLENIDTVSPEQSVEDNKDSVDQIQSDGIAKRKSGLYMDMVHTKGPKEARTLLGKHGDNGLRDVAEINTPKGEIINDIAPHPAGTSENTQNDELTTEISEDFSDIKPTNNDVQAEQSNDLDHHMQSKLEAELNGESYDTTEETVSGNSDMTINKDVSIDGISEVADITNNGDTYEEAESKAEPQADTAVAIADSPFLPDAKVDKRPLGGLPIDSDKKADNDTESTEQANVKESESLDLVPETADLDSVQEKEETDQSHEDSSAELPQEFQKDILAIESHNTLAEPASLGTAPSEEKSASVSSFKTESVVEEQHSSASSSNNTVQNSSITQQYKVKESTSDPTHTPIYDTNIQQLAHPVKKKSGWGTVAVVIVLIVLCVGGAVGVYFSGIL